MGCFKIHRYFKYSVYNNDYKLLNNYAVDKYDLFDNLTYISRLLATKS